MTILSLVYTNWMILNRKPASFAHVNHTSIHSCNQPVLSNESKVSCSRIQWEVLMGFNLTTYWLQIRRPTLVTAPQCPGLTGIDLSCTKTLGRIWPESVPILVRKHTEFVFSVQIRHRHRFCLQFCIVFWAESIRTRSFSVQIIVLDRFSILLIFLRQTFSTLWRVFYETDF